MVVLNKVVMVSKNLSGIKDLTGLALPILGLPKIHIKCRMLLRNEAHQSC